MGTLNECKIKTIQICESKGWDNVDISYLWMFLIEEIGELASSIRRTTNKFPDRKKTNIEGEIMDVLSYLFQIAHHFDIDLDKEWDKHLNKNA